MNRKNKIAAALLCAVLCVGTPAVPAVSDCAATVYAAGTLSAPQDITTQCSEGVLTVKWKKVSGADAYKISVKRGGESSYKTFKTVSSSSVKIPGLLYGETVSVRITPLKKDGSEFKAGTSVKFTKKIKCERAYIKDGLFVFDTTLLGKSSSQVAKALNKKLKLESWQWWTDTDGDPLKASFIALNDDVTMALMFDKDKKPIEAYVDLPVDTYDDSLKELAKTYYGDYRDITVYFDENDERLFYDRYDFDGGEIVFDMTTETYAEDDDIVLRQHYSIYERVFMD